MTCHSECRSGNDMERVHTWNGWTIRNTIPIAMKMKEMDIGIKYFQTDQRRKKGFFFVTRGSSNSPSNCNRVAS